MKVEFYIGIMDNFFVVDIYRKCVFLEWIVDSPEQEMLILYIVHMKLKSGETDKSSARFRWNERSVRSKVISPPMFLFLNLLFLSAYIISDYCKFSCLNLFI